VRHKQYLIDIYHLNILYKGYDKMKNIFEILMNFMTNQIIKKNKKYKVRNIYIYIIFLIIYEYFNNLNGDRDMTETNITIDMGEICKSCSHPPLKNIFLCFYFKFYN